MFVAIDPGGTTGVAIWPGGPDFSNLTRRHLTKDDHHRQLYGMLYELVPDVIICESFEYRKGLRDNLVLVSREYIGVVKLFVQRYPAVQLVMQTAAYGAMDKGNFWTSDKLKKVELYDSHYAPHGMDATCHLLQYLTFKRHEPAAHSLLEKLR